MTKHFQDDGLYPDDKEPNQDTFPKRGAYGRYKPKDGDAGEGSAVWAHVKDSDNEETPQEKQYRDSFQDIIDSLVKRIDGLSGRILCLEKEVEGLQQRRGYTNGQPL